MNRNPKHLLQFPMMVTELLWAIIYYTFTEVITFLIVATSVAVGAVLGWEWGGVFFLVSYTILRVVGVWLSSIFNFIGSTIAQLSYKETHDNNSIAQSRSVEARS